MHLALNQGNGDRYPSGAPTLHQEIHNVYLPIMYTNSTFMMKDNYSLLKEFEIFIDKLPKVLDLWNSANFTYGCCGRPIKKEGNINNSMDCPHCLEYIDFQNKKYSSFTGGTSYYSEAKFFTIKKDGEYKKTETGEFILKEYNSPLEIEESKLEEYVKVSLPGVKYEKIEKSYRKVRVNTLIRQEIGIINNITKVLFEGIPNYYGGTSYEELGTGNTFSSMEMDYLREKGLYTEFCDLLAFKQIFLNELIVKTLDTIVCKMQSAGMNLL